MSLYPPVSIFLKIIYTMSPYFVIILIGTFGISALLLFVSGSNVDLNITDTKHYENPEYKKLFEKIDFCNIENKSAKSNQICEDIVSNTLTLTETAITPEPTLIIAPTEKELVISTVPEFEPENNDFGEEIISINKQEVVGEIYDTTPLVVSESYEFEEDFISLDTSNSIKEIFENINTSEAFFEIVETNIDTL